MSGLVVSDLSVRLGPDGRRQRWAVNRVDLSVAAGEIVSVIGPNGAGKSTLLRAIAGLAPLSSGRILLNERDITTQPAYRRDVSWAPQEPALIPQFCVARNVFCGLAGGPRLALWLRACWPWRAAGTDWESLVERWFGVAARATFVEIRDWFGLAPLWDRPASQLSGGETRRVMLARALVRRPRLLLLDEPTAALDADQADSLRSLLKRWIRRERVSSLVVSHIQTDALSLADRVAVMEAGALLQPDLAQRLSDQPPTPFCAAFFRGQGFSRGSPPAKEA